MLLIEALVDDMIKVFPSASCACASDATCFRILQEAGKAAFEATPSLSVQSGWNPVLQTRAGSASTSLAHSVRTVPQHTHCPTIPHEPPRILAPTFQCSAMI